jgi:hypothetical protein
MIAIPAADDCRSLHLAKQLDGAGSGLMSLQEKGTVNLADFETEFGNNLA